MATWGDGEIHLNAVVPDVVVYPVGEGSFNDTETHIIENEKSQQHLDTG